MAVIGIDLGTTNSACSIWRNEQAELIPNALGEVLTPSVVGLDDNGELLVGATAKQRLITHADETVAVFKRLMGSEHKVKLKKQLYSAVELSALLLKALKADAEAFLGSEVKEAVISVPAYFNDNQRHATKMAGELAGLTVKRLVNEPTAAAMAYGLHDKKEGTFIILDMGGGTFDVSILEYFDGIMEVHASAGDNYLGGEDFVAAMAESVLEKLALGALSAVPNKDRQRLLMQMETLKRQLGGSEDKQSIQFEIGGEPHVFEADLAWFERLITPLLLRAKKPIEQALADAQMHASEIDDIILVGGATKLKQFRNNIGRLFGRFPSFSIDPDVVVALGAGIQAGLAAKDAALSDVVLTDVCPYTLGTEINGPDNNGGHFMPIIERNSIVPVSIVRTVYNAADNQTEVTINVYQGENRLVEKNIFLGRVNLKIPKGKAGEQAIDVRYSYDMNGLLEVDAKVVSSGVTASTVIENSPGSMTPEQLKASQAKLAKLKMHPREKEENRQVCARAERLYESSLGEKRELIAQVLADFDQILERQNPVEINKAREKLIELLEQLDTEEWF